jgi:predicted phage terminase large subunit-like protein
MGEYGFANQMQQLPTPRGGGLFKREWLEMWPPLDQEGNLMKGYINQGRIRYPAFEYVVAWVDTAFTTKQENDFCAMCVFGVFRAEGKGRIEKRNDGTFVRVADDYGFPKVMLVYGWQKRLTIHGPPQEVPVGVDARDWNGPQYREKRQETWGLVEWVADTCKRYKVDHLGIETQAAGHTLEQELARLHSDNIWTVELVPAKGDKVARAYAVQGIVSSKQFYVPTFEDGSHPSWATPIVDQWLIFPKGRHDDATDVMTGALRHLRDIGIFDRREDWHAEEERAQSWQTNRRTTLPYGLGG